MPDAVHGLALEGHRIRRAQAAKGYLQLETQGANSRGRIQLLLESWRPSPPDSYAAQLVGDVITKATHDDGGTLRVQFESGKSLECPPHPRHESWDVSVRPGSVRFSLPGGGWSGFEGQR